MGKLADKFATKEIFVAAVSKEFYQTMGADLFSHEVDPEDEWHVLEQLYRALILAQNVQRKLYDKSPKIIRDI